MEACRKGLSHDLPNQLVALHGLLHLLEMEEAHRLGSAGQDYVRRLLGVARRTQALTRTLKEIASIGADTSPLTLVSLPDIVEEVLAEWRPPPACTQSWEVAHALAPPRPLQIVLSQALRLLVDSREGGPALLNLGSRTSPSGVELSLDVSAIAQITPLTPAPTAAELSGAWHERVECVLIRELAHSWGSSVQWRKSGDRLGVTITLAAPP